jgi:hypothetical protein
MYMEMAYAVARLGAWRPQSGREGLRAQAAFPDAEIPRPGPEVRFEVWRRIIGE